MEELVIKYGCIYLVSLACIFVLFRKMLYSVLDPAIWLIPLFSSLIALSYYTNLFSYLVCSILAFWMGMYVINGNRVTRNFEPARISNLLTLKVFTEIVFGVYILACLYIFKKSGIPLLSDNPTESKIAVFEGVGIIRRITMIGGLLPINLTLLIFASTNKKRYILLLVIYSFVKLLLGSKSSVIGLVFPLLYFITQKNLSPKAIPFSQYRKYLYAIFAVSIAIFVVIVSKEAELEGSSLIFSMGFRLMEFGDVMLFYQDDSVQAVFAGYDFMRFIPDELNNILGMFRLAPYNDPLGFVMAQEAAGKFLDTIVGPNIPLPIKGHIYGGVFGGIAYSFIIGIVFAKIRKFFFTMQIRDIFFYSIIAFVFFNLMGIIRQSEAFISLIFDYFFYTFPILFVSQLLIRFYGPARERNSMQQQN